jgi:hypothetical protein
MALQQQHPSLRRVLVEQRASPRPHRRQRRPQQQQQQQLPGPSTTG